MDDLIEHVSQQLATIADLPVGSRLAQAVIPAPDRSIAGLIDHTLLKPEATPAQIEQLCAEAAEHRFASVCVNPAYVPLCVQRLANTPVAVCTVIGFPLGATTTDVKVFEAAQAVADGARELDMVIAIGQLKAGQYRRVAEDIRQVAAIGHTQGALVKVIIETILLSDEEKVAACLLAARAGADVVKTSTGFAGGGATVADVTLMRRTVGPEVGVKAAGGVRSLAEARAMIAAGATRIGTSAGIAILQEAEGTGTPSDTDGY
ncbi:MAG: deoxyribose-phosphate aldolase [Oscillochloris sp.]|nr:deoxyribose-phosphate aldolase [Oscillochloris sp.]